MIELRIEHKDGPEAGKVHTFGVDALRVTIGTDPNAEVVYPPTTPGIAAEHAELVRGAGRYELHLNPSALTLRNGQIAVQGEGLEEGDELRFGGTKGPAITIGYLTQPPWQRRPKHLTAAIAVVLVTLGAGLLWLKSWHDREEVARTAAEMLLARPIELRPTDWARILNLVRPSVYEVAEKGVDGSETPLATAWVIAPGRLATNAHVAERIKEDRRQSRLLVVVRSPVPPFNESEISDVVEHPGFLQFQRVWQDYSPQLLDPSSGEYHVLKPAGAYDVAILTVKDGTSLEPPLPIADDATLQALRPGDAIAFVGYPAERMLDVDPTRPNPRNQTGVIVSMTTFARTVGTPATAQLIEHSLPGTGGASGSPIVNARGEVIAIFNGGNILASSDGNRMPNPAQVNFAQRIDVIRPLLGPSVAYQPDDALNDWRADLGQYPSADVAAQTSLAAALDQWRDGRVSEPILKLDRELDQSVEEHVRTSSVQLSLKPGAYMASATATFCKRFGLELTEKLSKIAKPHSLGHNGHVLCYADVPFALTTDHSINLGLYAVTDAATPVKAHIVVYRKVEGGTEGSVK